jgi:hypothetical protein
VRRPSRRRRPDAATEVRHVRRLFEGDRGAAEDGAAVKRATGLWTGCDFFALDLRALERDAYRKLEHRKSPSC